MPIELLVYDNANYGVPQILEVMVKYLRDHAQDTVGKSNCSCTAHFGCAF